MLFFRSTYDIRGSRQGHASVKNSSSVPVAKTFWTSLHSTVSICACVSALQTCTNLTSLRGYREKDIEINTEGRDWTMEGMQLHRSLN